MTSLSGENLNPVLLAANHAAALELRQRLFGLLGVDLNGSSFSLVQQFWPDAASVTLELLPSFLAFLEGATRQPELREQMFYWLHQGGYQIMPNFLSDCARASNLGIGGRDATHVTHDRKAMGEIIDAPADKFNHGRALARPFSHMIIFLYYYDLYAPAISTDAAYDMANFRGPSVVANLLGMFDDMLETLATYSRH
jgi:hypothetical protein